MIKFTKEKGKNWNSLIISFFKKWYIGYVNTKYVLSVSINGKGYGFSKYNKYKKI